MSRFRISGKGRQRGLPIPQHPVAAASKGSPAAGPAASEESVRPKTWRVNLRFLGISLVVMVILAAGAKFLHDYEVRANARQLLTRSEQAEKEGRRDDAASLLNQYINLTYSSRKAGSKEEEQVHTGLLARLGRLTDPGDDPSRPAQLFRAYRTFEEVLRRDPGLNDVRERVAEIAILFRRYPDALDHLKILAPMSVADPAKRLALLKMQGQCQIAQQDLQDGQLTYLEALAANPTDSSLYLTIAGLWFELPDKAINAADHPALADPKFDSLRGLIPTINAGRKRGARQSAAALLSQMTGKIAPAGSTELNRARFLLNARFKDERAPETNVSLAKSSAGQIINEADSNHDGLLTGAELLDATVPVLSDLNHDGQLDEAELAVRLTYGDRKSLLIEAERSILVALDEDQPATATSNASDQAERFLVAAEIETALGDASNLEDIVALKQASEGERRRKDFLASARKYAELGAKADPSDSRLAIALTELILREANEATDRPLRLAKLREADQYLKKSIDTEKPSTDGAAPPATDDALNSAAMRIKLRWLRADVLYSIANAEDPKDAPTAVEAAQKVVEDLKTLKPAQFLIDALAARELLVTRNWSEARPALEKLRNTQTVGSELWRRCTAQLGECLTELGNTDAVLDLYRVAAQTDQIYPTVLQWRWGEAGALTDLGRIDEASDKYAALAQQRLVGATRRLVELQLLRQSFLPVDQRRWEVLDQALALPETLPESDAIELKWNAPLNVYWADHAYLRSVTETELDKDHPSPGRADRAAMLLDFAELVLQKAEVEFADDPRIPAAHAALAMRRPNQDVAQRLEEMRKILDKAVKRLGEKIEFRLAAVNSISLLPPELGRQVLADASHDLERFPTDEQAQLLEALARGYVTISSDDLAIELWEQATKLQPAELRHHIAILELMLARAATPDEPKKIDNSAWTRHMLAVSAIEGLSAPGPYERLLTARRTVLESVRNSELLADRPKLAAALKPARDSLEAAARLRMYWAVVPKELGRIDLLLGEREAAVEQFEKAVELGDHSEAVVGPLLEHYQQRALSVDAATSMEYKEKGARLVELVEQKNPALLSGDIGKLASTVMSQRADYEHAIGLADRLQKLTPEDKILKAYWHLTSVKAPVGAAAKSTAPLQTSDFNSESKDALEQAEKLLKQAVSEAPQLPKAWIALVTYHVQLRNLELARETMAKAAVQLPESPAYVRPFTAAYCDEILLYSGLLTADDAKKTRDHAEQQYNAALESDPSNPNLKYSVAAFEKKMGRPEKAASLLEDLLDPNVQISKASRAQATIARAASLAATGDRKQFEQAIDLLTPAEVPEKGWQSRFLRAKANILGRGLTPNDRKRLIETLESLKSLEPLSAPEKAQLARAYTASSQWVKAEPLFLSVLETTPSDAVVLADYCEGLIRNQQLEKAGEQLKLLDSMMPGFIGVVGLKAKLLHAQGQTDQAADLIVESFKALNVTQSEASLSLLANQIKRDKAAEIINAYIKDHEGQIDPTTARIAGDAATAGNTEAAIQALGPSFTREAMNGAVYDIGYRLSLRLLEEFARPAAAEAVCRQYLKVTDKLQEQITLAAFIGQQGRIDEALDICDEAKDEVQPQAAATTAMRMAATGALSAKQLDRVDQILAEAVRRKPNSMFLAAQLAALRNLQGRYDEASVLYSVMLEKDPDFILALNNLAVIFAFQGKKLDQALTMIDHAIEHGGRTPDLLDTRGSVLTALGKFAEAAHDLEASIAAAPSAIAYWHLARAQMEAGNSAEARKSFAQAKEAGIKEESLHNLERKAFQDLQSQLDPRLETRR
jgi:Tfp pilus assembly protein PilF